MPNNTSHIPLDIYKWCAEIAVESSINAGFTPTPEQFEWMVNTLADEAMRLITKMGMENSKKASS